MTMMFSFPLYTTIAFKSYIPLMFSKRTFLYLVTLQVAQDENGSKGYGFVHFETQESADMAIQKVNQMLLQDKKV